MDGYVPNNPNVEADLGNWQWFSPLRHASSTSPEPGPLPGALPPCPSPPLLHQLDPFEQQLDCLHEFEQAESTAFAPLPNVHTLNSYNSEEDALLPDSLAEEKIDGFLNPMKPAESASHSVDSSITGYDSPYTTSQWCLQQPPDNNQLSGAMQSYSLPDQHMLHGLSVNVGVSMNIGIGGGYQPYLTDESAQTWYGDAKAYDSCGVLLQPPMTSPFSSAPGAALPSSSIACYSTTHDQRLDGGGFYNNSPAYSIVNNQCTSQFPTEGGVYGHYDNSQLFTCKNEAPSELIDKSNVCRICGKAYARPSTLKTHMRTHSGERPYRCHQCCKSFSQAANLTAHVRTHSGEKPFRCPICDRRFSQSSSVTTHMRTHSGDRPYRCRMCKKSFSDSSTLTKHMRIHSGEKPYQCKVCMLRFSQSGNLNRHMRVHSSQYC